MAHKLTLDAVKPIPGFIRVDRTGFQNKEMTVLGFSDKREGQIFWIARCSCGNVWEVRSSNLTRTTRCKTCSSNCFRPVTTHGMSKTKVYYLWESTKKRGGSRICPSWEKFEGFYADVGDPPKNSHFHVPLEGPVNKDTAKFREGHQRNRKITAFGETRNLTEWAIRLGLTTERIRQRVNDALECGDSMEHALRSALTVVEVSELATKKWERISAAKLEVFNQYLDGEIHVFKAEDPLHTILILRRIAKGRKVHARVFDNHVLFKADLPR